MLARRPSFPDTFHRLIAMGCAALVFALTMLAASPVAHERLHDGDCSHTPASDDRCAVVLFDGGVSPTLSPLALAEPLTVARDVVPARAAEFFLVSPRYLRQPERGPPVRS